MPPLGLTVITFYLITPTGANQLVASIAEPETASRCTSDLGVVIVDRLDRPALNTRDYAALNTTTLNRAQFGIEWMLANPNSKLILIGNDGNSSSIGAKQITYNYIINFVGQQGTVVSATSDNSPVASANYMADNFDADNTAVFASDIDTRRINLAFENKGITTCNVITKSHRLSQHPIRMLLPNGDSISVVNLVLWEYVGMLWYKLNGTA